MLGFLTGLMWIAIVMAGCAAAAWIFREILRRTMPEVIAKPARQAPLTAAFGVLVIILYVFCAIFADVIAPYGQNEIFDKTFLPPGGDPEIG
ncbi:MAG: ABC transporter permease, partial [Pseudomonadota bacterium]